MNRRIHDLALFILSKIESEDKANQVFSFLDTWCRKRHGLLYHLFLSLFEVCGHLDAVFRKLELIGW